MSRTKILGLVLLLTLVGLVVLPFTASGTQFVIAKVNQLTPLRVSYGGGSFGGALKLNELGFSQDGLSVEAHNIEFTLGLRCLLVSKVCIDSLLVENLIVDLDPGTARAQDSELVEHQEDPDESTEFEFPVAVEIASIVLGATEIDWADGGLLSGPIEGAIGASGKQLSLRNWRARDTALSIAAAEDSEPAPDEAIDLPELKLPFELLVVGLTLESPSWNLGEIQHRHRSIALDLRWIETTLTFDKLSVSSDGWGELNLGGSIEVADIWEMDLNAEAALTEPPIWSGLHQQSVKVAAIGKLNRLEFSAGLSGDQVFSLEGYVDLTNQELPFDVALNGSWTGTLALGDIAGMGGELPDISLVSPWIVTASGSSTQQTLSVTGSAEGLGYRQLALSVEATHDDGEILVDTLNLLDPSTASSMSSTGTVFVGDNVRWNFDLRSSGFDFPVIEQLPSGRIEGELNIGGQVSDAGWQVHLNQVDLQGKVDGVDAQLRGKIAVNSDLEIFDSRINLRAEDTTLSVLATPDKPPELNLDVEDVGRWLAGGSGSVDVRATLEDRQQRLVFNGSARNLVLKDMAMALATVEGDFDVHKLSNLNVRVRSAELEYQQLQLSGIDTSLSTTDNRHELSLSVAGDLKTDLKLHGSFDDKLWSGQLKPASIGTPVGDWNLDEAVDVIWRRDTAEGSVAAHCWVHGQASICPGKILVGDLIAGKVDIKGNLQLLQPLLPADSTLAGEAAVAMEFGSEPQGDLKLSANGTFLEGSINRTVAGKEVAVAWDKIVGSGSFGPDKSLIALEFWRDKLQELSVDVSVPRQENKPLDGRISFDSFDVGGLVASFIPAAVDPKGILDGELLLAGTGNAPMLNGSVTLSEGQFSLAENPTSFEAISANITAQGTRANLKGTALVGSGETELSGSLTWQFEPGLDLTISGREQTVFLPPGLEARVSENLRLRASKGALELTGEVTVHEGMLEYAQLPEGSVGVSADVVEVDYQGQLLQDEDAIDLVADLKLGILDAFQVVGTGLHTTVGGELELKKQSAQPLQLFGELNIIDGQIEALGQVLEVRKGSLSFVGAPDNPDLSIRAQRKIPAENIEVGLELLGALDAFTFSIYSTPALPENEAMSYLIRGRGLDQGAQVDGTALALSVGLGAVNKLGLFEGLNKLPGVNNISFGAEGEADDTTATVSAYLGERLYLSYGIGVYEPLNVLTARLYLQTQLWLEVVSSLESSGDIYYSIDLE